MKNKEFWQVKEELDKIEARRSEQKKKYDTYREEKKTDAFKKNSLTGKLNKQTVLLTLISTGAIMVCLILLNLVIRAAMGTELTFSNIIHETLPILPGLPLMAVLLYFAFRYTAKKSSVVFEAVKDVSNGEINTRLEAVKDEPYKSVYEDFNTMCENIEVAEEDLNKAVELANEANAAKSRFLSSVSHEIRTPANAVLGLDEMIIRESTEEKTLAYARDIKTAGKALLGIINTILDSSKIESGKMEILEDTYDLSSMISDIVSMYEPTATQKGLEFKVEVEPETPEKLFGDELRIKQCVLNLVSNAIKFTDKGTITLSFGYAKLSNDEVKLNISVLDTGQGIKRDDMERLFAPFERMEENKNLNVEGTGLGLSLTRQLLNLMGSELEVRSEFGMGSEFFFSVKQRVTDWRMIGNLSKGFEELENSEGEYVESFHAPEARVLVVDDSSVNLMIVEGLLSKTQLKIDKAESGPEAIKLSKENKYDIALVDYMMPDMDGVETMRHLRNDNDSLNRRIPILVLTANAVSGAREGYIKEGFTDYISKPIAPAKLERIVKNYLPKHLIVEVERSEADTPKEPKASEPKSGIIAKLVQIEAIDTTLGLQYSGSPELYEKILGEYTETGSSRADTIEQYFEQQDIQNYTIQVHALKSASRLIGAMTLSKLAEKLEKCGNENDTETIGKETPELLKQYRDIVAALTPLFESGENLPMIEDDMLKEAVNALREMVEGFDFDSADKVMEDLKKYKMPDDFAKIYAKLKTLMAEVARDDIIELLKEF